MQPRTFEGKVQISVEAFTPLKELHEDYIGSYCISSTSLYFDRSKHLGKQDTRCKSHCSVCTVVATAMNGARKAVHLLPPSMLLLHLETTSRSKKISHMQR